VNASSRSGAVARLTVALVVSSLAMVVTAPVAFSASAAGSPELCRVVSSASDSGGGSAVGLSTAHARESVDALRKAVKQSLPRKVKNAIKQLIPRYESFTSGGGAKSLAILEGYATTNCGGSSGDGTTGSASDIDICGLVTHDEAEALVKTPLEAAVAEPGRCAYTGPASGPVAQVEVYVGDGAMKFLDIERDAGQVLTPISDLGDEAYAEPEVGSIFFQKSGTWVAIHLVLLNDPAENVQPLEALARNVAARI
jgi:hypothetical protein